MVECLEIVLKLKDCWVCWGMFKLVIEKYLLSMLSFYIGTWKRTRLVFNNMILICCLYFILQEQNILSLKFQLK